MAKSLLALDWRRVVVVASIAAIFAFLGAYAVGTVSNARNFALLEAVIPTTRYLGFAAISGPATILALMMTVLSFGRGWSQNFRPEYFDKIRQVALLSALAIVAGVFLLLLLNIPLQKSESFEAWHGVLYYSITTYASVLGGIIIALVFLLYNVVAILISAVDPHVDSSNAFDAADNETT